MLRALRVLRLLRLITIVPSLRRVVGGLIGALPGMGSIVLLIGLIYYVCAVMAVNLFGEDFPPCSARCRPRCSPCSPS